MVSNQIHNPSSFKHLVGPYSKMGYEHTNTSVLKWNGYKNVMATRRGGRYLVSLDQLIEELNSSEKRKRQSYALARLNHTHEASTVSTSAMWKVKTVACGLLG